MKHSGRWELIIEIVPIPDDRQGQNQGYTHVIYKALIYFFENFLGDLNNYDEKV